MLKWPKKIQNQEKNNVAKTYSKYYKIKNLVTKKKINVVSEKINRIEEIDFVSGSVKTRKMNDFFNILFMVIAVLFGFLGALIYGSSNWVMSTWGNLSVDEIIFHLKVPVEGTNADLIQNYISICVLAAIVMIFVSVILITGVWEKPLYRYLMMSTIIGASAWAIIASIQLVWTGLDVKEYIASQSENSTFIRDNYVDPRRVQLTFPEQKRNLIYIYLESMETTYMDKKSGGAFKENYIPELTELARENINFSNTEGVGGGYTTTGTTWTMGGFFAQTSGLPLKLPIDGNAMDQQSDFFPDIIALGDILNEEGYSQTFLCGSDATFGGRRKYFEQHGDYEIVDLLSVKADGDLPEDYSVWWGYEDEKEFAFAKNEIEKLAASGNPFDFTLLTADTHFEDGYVCNLCDSKFGENQYANVLACSSRQVASFIKWIQQQEFYENTTIVISGDHLTMDSDFCTDISDRSIYNVIINGATEEKNTKNREFSTLDMMPTTLASLGVEIEGDKLGLGVNLYSGKKTLVEREGIKKLNKKLNAKSSFFDNFTKSIVVSEEEMNNE